MVMTYSRRGLQMTQGFEGLRLRAYQDTGGVWTIGYGHVGAAAVAGAQVTEAEAVRLLQGDIAWAVREVNETATRPLEQHEFDALVDFCFNVGAGAFRRSAVMSAANAGDNAGVQRHLGEWVSVGGRPSAGLARRRAAECALWRGE